MRQRLRSTFLLISSVLMACLLIAGAPVLQANEDFSIMVVTNKDVNLQSIEDNEIRRLFLGKSRRLPNGDRAALAAFVPLKSVFNSQVLGESSIHVARIWSRLRFSGRQPPPRTYDSIDAIVEYIRTTPNALAYLPSTYKGGDVRVMTTFPVADFPLR